VDEIVVVVDGASDGTLDYLREVASTEARVRYLDNGVNRGVAFSKNAGVDAARGEDVFVAEDDVELTPGFFATLLEHRRSSKADVIAGRNIWRYEHESAEEAVARTDLLKGPPVDLRRVMVDTSIRIEHDEVQLLLPGPVLAPRELLREIRFDERYRANAWREETDFQLSAQEAGYVLVSCPHAICFNYMLANDRGGAYATIGLRRLYWVTVNNWRFVSKHSGFLDEHFAIGSRLAHVASTSTRLGWEEMVLPGLVGLKRRLVASPD